MSYSSSSSDDDDDKSETSTTSNVATWDDDSTVNIGGHLKGTTEQTLCMKAET